MTLQSSQDHEQNDAAAAGREARDQGVQSLRLRDRLYFRQARLAVITALVLGVILNLAQIAYDLRSEERRVAEVVNSFFLTTRETAVQAAYTLDKTLAARITHGLLAYAPVHEVLFLDDFGDTLAYQFRAKTESSWRGMAELAFGQHHQFEFALKHDETGEKVGTLVLRLDPHEVARDFIERSGLVIAGGLVRNLIFALVLTFLFYRSLGRPIVAAAEALQRKSGQDCELIIPQAHQRDELGMLMRSMNDAFRREQMLREANLAAERRLAHSRKMESIGQLTGGVAHDFNNMLASILGYAQLAKRYLQKQPSQRLSGYMQEITTAGERGRDLIKQMMDFVSEAGETQPTPMNVGTAMDGVLEMLRSTLPASIRVVVDVAPDCPPVLISPVQFEQILLNLCVNARDAMNGVGEIRMRAARAERLPSECDSCHRGLDGEYVAIVVADTGPGMEPETCARCFDPFHTTKPFGEGSGMGLAIVHGAVHEVSGHVLVESAPSHGTQFTILLRSTDQGLSIAA